MVTLSVVMPSLNSRRYIGDAIQSVVSQGFDDFELVIQDGGSTDGTEDVARSFADARISWISEADNGQADALNRAMARAQGEWVLWLNADDLLAAGALETMTPILRTADASVIHGDFGIIDAEGYIVKRYSCLPLSFERLLKRGAYVFSGSTFVRRSLLGSVDWLDPHLHFCLDYDWLLRLAKSRSVGYEPVIVAFLRDHADSKSRKQPWGFWREQWIVRRRYDVSYVDAVAYQARMAAGFLIRPATRSRAWRRIRPAKTL
jgi:glycosyltransferase involved in cell wall biosynthesis